jgi:hypothetical protein
VISDWFHDYSTLEDRAMIDQEEKSVKEVKLAENRAAIDANRLVKEQAIREEQSAKEAKREEKHASEEPARLAKERARRKTDLAREEAITADLKARKLKDESNHQSK